MAGIIIARPTGMSTGSEVQQNTLTWQDEGTDLGSFDNINLIGTGMFGTSTTSSTLTIYVPPPVFLSHWNTSDGDNGNQSVAEFLVSRTTAKISTPADGEGSPFNTNGWADSDQDATLATSASFTTPASTSGFGGDSTITVNFLDADSSIITSFITPYLTGNTTHINTSGTISVDISEYVTGTIRASAKAVVTVDSLSILNDLVLSGGRYSTEITHSTDSGTDGTGDYIFVQDDVFLDTNPTTPVINGAVGISERSDRALTKHISGIEYYILNSKFIVDIADIDNLNENTQRQSDNLQVDFSDYGAGVLSWTGWGGQSSNFVNWSNNHNQNNISYINSGIEITQTNYRFVDDEATINAFVRDSWNNSSVITSPEGYVAIDTFGITATDYVENFDDESRRQDIDFNGGLPNGNWNSDAFLTGSAAAVFNGKIMFPNTIDELAPSTDLSLCLPNSSGTQPDYTNNIGSLDSDGRRYVDYFYTVDDTSSGASRPSFSFVFAGTFASGSATADLADSALQIFVRRINVAGGPAGPPYIGHLNSFPLIVHSGTFGAFNEASDDDNDRRIRESSSSGNTVNCTFGGDSAIDGIYVHVRIRNPLIKIDSISTTFF